MEQLAEEFVHAIYGAVLDSEKWDVALSTMAALADAEHALVMDADFAAGVLYRSVLFGIDEADNRRYMMEYASFDPRVPVVLGHNKLAWQSDYDYFDDAFRKKDRFYREFMTPRRGGESLMAMIAKEGSRIGTSALIRDVSKGRAEKAIRQRLDGLVPHLDRAVKISRRFAALASEAVLAHNVLDALSEPLACLTGDGHLLRANRAFEGVLRTGGALSLRNGVVQVDLSETQPQFLRAVRECCRIAEGGSSGDPEAALTFRIDHRTRGTCFVTVAPLATVNLQSWAGRPCAMVRIDELNNDLPPEKLIEALGLSPAEARLVSALNRGGTLAEAAERAGVTSNTAKTQLASVFSKTGTTRQSELIALVATLPKIR